MPDPDAMRLDRIARKRTATADPMVSLSPCTSRRMYRRGPWPPESEVASFEARHGVVLPSAYRSYLTELGGADGAPFWPDDFGCPPEGSTHLAQPCPFLPGRSYPGDWYLYMADEHAFTAEGLAGCVRIVTYGLSMATYLIVTGPARGRMLNVDDDSRSGPCVLEDADFLAWYERWLDEAAAGYQIWGSPERLPLAEPDQITVLATDPSPVRRVRAAASLLRYPTLGDRARAAVTRALTTDEDLRVRAEVWFHLTSTQHPRRPENADAIADDIARQARSSDPPDVAALGFVNRITHTDVVTALDSDDLDVRRRAAFELNSDWNFERGAAVRDERLDAAVGRLLIDPDPVLRANGVTAASWYELTRYEPVVLAMWEAEADPRVRREIEHQFPDLVDPRP